VSWAGALGVIAASGVGFPVAAADAGKVRWLVLPALLAGPALAGLALTAILDGRRGLRALLARQARVAVGGGWYATLLMAPGAMALVLGLLSLSSPGFRPALLAGPHAAAIAVAAVAAGLVIGFFEELAQLLHASFTGGQLLLWPSRVSALEGVLWYGCFALLVTAAAVLATFHKSSK
jgi:hypothetical protein